MGGEQALKALKLASLIEEMALDSQEWHGGEVVTEYQDATLALSASV